MVNILSLQLKEIAKENSVRFDVDFLRYSLRINNLGSYSFSDLFEIVEHRKPVIDDQFNYCEIGDVDSSGDIHPTLLDISNRNELNEPLFQKIEKGDIFLPAAGNILISSVRPNLRKIIYCSQEICKCYFTKAFLEIRPLKSGKLLFYLLRNFFVNDLVFVSRQGKGYPTIKYLDLLQMKFNRKIVDAILLNAEILTQYIEQVENRVQKLKGKRIDHSILIDNVFSNYFEYDLAKLLDSRKISSVVGSLFKFSQNKDLRFDYRFHSEYGECAKSILGTFCNSRIQDYLLEPIKMGVSISPSDYDNDSQSEFLYLSMASIKNWQFNPENSTIVSEEFWNNHKAESCIRPNDILLARSGEGTIGKVAIIENEINAIYCDFTMRIRLTNYMPKFAYYYFRTKPFQYLIESNKKGLGNNTNIFPIQVKEFPLPSIPISEQILICSKIDALINNQEILESQIGKEYADINDVMKRAMKGLLPTAYA